MFCITKSVAFQKVVVKAFLCIPWGKIVKIITFSQYFQFSSINLVRTLCKPHIKVIIRLFVTIFLKSIQKGSFLLLQSVKLRSYPFQGTFTNYCFITLIVPLKNFISNCNVFFLCMPKFITFHVPF